MGESNKDHDSGILTFKRKRSTLFKCKDCDFYAKNQQQLEDHRGLHDDSEVDDPPLKRPSIDRAFKAKITKSIDYKLPSAPRGSSDEPKIAKSDLHDNCKSNEVTSHCTDEDVFNCTPFKCDCGKFYKTKKSLTQHIKGKTAGKRFCGTSNTLKVHTDIYGKNRQQLEEHLGMSIDSEVDDPPPKRTSITDCSFKAKIKKNNDDKLPSSTQLSDEPKIVNPAIDDHRESDKIMSQYDEEAANRTAFKCDCGKFFKTQRILTKHIQNKTVGKPFKCAECDFACSTSNNLKIHKMVHTDEKPHHCKLCDYACRHGNMLQRHNRVKHGVDPLPCGKCDFTALRIVALFNHQFKEHGIPRPHVCKICGRRFNQKETLKVHMNIHSPDKPFSCKVCNRDFRLAYTLKLHMNTHLEEKPFNCNLCDKSYNSKVGLVTHREQKHENKPRKTYACDVCSSVFKTHAGIKSHKMSHTGEKPFKCDQCDYQTSYEFNLQKHRYVHSGIKPFKCPFCNYACRNPSNLKVHKKTHIASTKTLSEHDIKPQMKGDMNGNVRVRIKHEDLESSEILNTKPKFCAKIRIYADSVKIEKLDENDIIQSKSSLIKLEDNHPGKGFDFENVVVKQEPNN